MLNFDNNKKSNSNFVKHKDDVTNKTSYAKSTKGQ